MNFPTKPLPALLVGATMLLLATGCDQIAPPGMGADDQADGLQSPGTTAPSTPGTAPRATPGATLPPGHPPIDQPPALPDGGGGSETVASFLGLTAPKPPSWVWHPPLNSMRKANYTVAGADGNDAAELIVFFFGAGQGGGVDANIARWVGQFQMAGGGPVEPIIGDTEADGMPITLVELAGEYRQMGQAWFTPDQLFLAAIVDAPVGRVFIRLTGPTATVEANRPAFEEMIAGLKKTTP